jgi:hypothetical protein
VPSANRTWVQLSWQSIGETTVNLANRSLVLTSTSTNFTLGGVGGNASAPVMLSLVIAPQCSARRRRLRVPPNGHQ